MSKSAGAQALEKVREQITEERRYTSRTNPRRVVMTIEMTGDKVLRCIIKYKDLDPADLGPVAGNIAAIKPTTSRALKLIREQSWDLCDIKVNI